MSETPAMPMTKRDLLALIGKSAGATTMLMAMSSLGQVQASTFKGPIKLEGGSNGRSVLILGAGVAGMVAALELSRAGYKVQVLEYNDRIGGRAWTLRGGDKFTELGGATQTCEFAPGNYINPGPWRIPTEHGGLIHGVNPNVASRERPRERICCAAISMYASDSTKHAFICGICEQFILHCVIAPATSCSH